MPTLPNMAQYVIWNIQDPVPDAVIESIARQYTRPAPGPSDYLRNFAKPDVSGIAAIFGGVSKSNEFPSFGFQSLYWSLKARHLLYWKAIPASFLNGQQTGNSDCGAPGINVTPPSSVTVQSEQIGNKVLTAIPIVGGFLSSIAGAIEGLIGRHHAAAVAKEQETLCAIVPGINYQMDQLDAAVASGQISIEQEIEQLQQTLGQLTAAVASIEQNCNESCVIEDELSANIALRQWMAVNLEMMSGGILSGGLGGISPLELAIGGAIAAYEIL
jgi:hypothetical protein